MSVTVTTLTWRELKDQIGSFTEDQLDTKVMCSDGGFAMQIEVMAEDHINPSGEGWEPRSLYGSEADEEPVVAAKGQPILVVDK